ncbi:MAG: DUF1566 domain-containing protein [Leptospiraceae bacterium]|nr:DUF1566 domain-containing protein [Leptospiraceae bacterium]
MAGQRVALKVSAVYPANGAVDVSANTSITVTFSEAMEPSSITANTTDTSCATGTFLVSSDDFATCVQAKGSITIGSNNVDYVFQPASNLTEGATYKVKIKSTVKDASNVAMGADYVQATGFKIASSGTTTPTTDTTPPTVSSVYPTDGSTGIGIDANITATFSETLLSSSVTATSFLLKQGASIIPAAVSLNGTLATLNPDSNLTGNTTYTVILTTAIKDAAGNALASNYTWSFTSGTAISGAVETPTFSPNAGHYSTAQNITISTATTGASIYYTTDETTPTASSTLYTTPIHIWSLAGKTVKAIAKKSGMTDSAVATLSGVFSYPPLKTGQTVSGGTNSDGALQNGVSRSYTGPTQHGTYTSDYTTTDNATGLVWKTCTQGLSGASCGTGTAVSNLTWANATSDATNGCSALNSANGGNGYAGIKTWRLPTASEVNTIIDLGKTPAPQIDINSFPATVSGSYWSSTTNGTNTGQAVVFSFANSQVTFSGKTGTNYVRCVSGYSKDESKSFSDKGDGTIEDKATGLIWQKCGINLNATNCSGTLSTTTWSGALTYCNSTLTLAGRTWRVPNRNEMQSIVDFSKSSSPFIDITMFPVNGYDYWTSSTDMLNTSLGWQWTISNGSSFAYYKTSTDRNVRCVSGP